MHDVEWGKTYVVDVFLHGKLFTVSGVAEDVFPDSFVLRPPSPPVGRKSTGVEVMRSAVVSITEHR